MEIKNSFRDHLNRSSEIVRHWPSWKQNVDHDRIKSTDSGDGKALATSALGNQKKLAVIDN